MRKPLTATLLLGGHLLLGALITPVAASAAMPSPSGPNHTSSYDNHYRCMYHCAERGYDHSGYDRYRSDRYRQNRVYHNGECWNHDGGGWHRCGYGHYDSQRRHPRNW
jgi:hypothetical protein